MHTRRESLKLKEPPTLKHSNKTILWFVAATLLVMFGIAVTFWSYRQINEAAALRLHTHIVLSEANNILSELKDAETGERGFLLTGNEAFLQPYLAVRNGIEGRWKPYESSPRSARLNIT